MRFDVVAVDVGVLLWLLRVKLGELGVRSRGCSGVAGI
jgi:hypothetical protein